MILASHYIERQVNKNGLFNILEPPIPGKTYLAGIDPNPFGDREVDDGSDFAIIIGCPEDGALVAYYAERSMDSDYVIENSILLQEYYASEKFPFGAPAMMEMNRAEVAFREYTAKGKLNLLSKRAVHIGSEFKDSKKKERYGWNKDVQSGREAAASDLMVKFLKLYADKIRIDRLVKELNRFPKGNNDLVDAFRGYCILHFEYLAKQIKKYSQPQTKLRKYKTMENGLIVEKWHEVPIGENPIFDF
jgi:hypothetical protein